ncbi:hypothetical protein C2G38_2089744 [Gigaspora rosea]|uniref:Uncharacterized protein n=1 Tax=Gigaspora rosea TaxID=44941 RepID=A0A397VC50_9GLOM|nr:hypothetical protein C2G38_2089744 [Gigaspora rosea]
MISKLAIAFILLISNNNFKLAITFIHLQYCISINKNKLETFQTFMLIIFGLRPKAKITNQRT